MTEPMDSAARARAARGLLRSRQSGILSTQSLELAGFPFGSVTPYVMTHAGRVAILVSAIAEHTANMRADSKVCLTAVEAGEGNQQALGRVSLLGLAELVPEEGLPEVQGRYFRLFPEARHYSQAHAFDFFWIVPTRTRYIAGFGQIFWVEPEQWCLPEPEWKAREEVILEHMNRDHAPAVRAIALRRGADEAESARMLALDVEGCHVQAGATRVYAPFARPAASEESLRGALIELAREA